MGLTLIILIILIIGMLAFVAAPVIRGGGRRRGQAREDALGEKRAAMQLLADLDHDRQTGKLLADDYETQRREVESRAIRALKNLDAITGKGEREPVEQLIEAERVRLRKESRR